VARRFHLFREHFVEPDRERKPRIQ
jgi:hypothetical protein